MSSFGLHDIRGHFQRVAHSESPFFTRILGPLASLIVGGTVFIAGYSDIMSSHWPNVIYAFLLSIIGSDSFIFGVTFIWVLFLPDIPYNSRLTTKEQHQANRFLIPIFLIPFALPITVIVQERRRHHS